MLRVALHKRIALEWAADQQAVVRAIIGQSTFQLLAHFPHMVGLLGSRDQGTPCSPRAVVQAAHSSCSKATPNPQELMGDFYFGILTSWYLGYYWL